MSYAYTDIKDKSTEGMDTELKDGLTIAAVYFQQTLGVPLEHFEDWMTTKLRNKAEQWLWYMNFRNKNPGLFE